MNALKPDSQKWNPLNTHKGHPNTTIHNTQNQNTQNTPHNHQNSKIDNCKLEDGNGPILSLKESAPVLEVDILLLFQELLLLFLEDTTTQEKHRAILI